MDAYCLYWLVNLAAGVPLDGYYNDAAEALGDKTPPEAEEVVNTLKTLDFNTIDTVAIMYDATDYLMGNAMYNDDNPTDPTQFTGNLEASLEVLQRLYPQIRIIVMSPTYAYAIDEDGNYVSSDIYIYNGRDVLSTYVIKECYSSNLHSVSFMDNLYGSITEDNAKEYLTDNLHLNVKGRKLIAKRFEYTGIINRIDDRILLPPRWLSCLFRVVFFCFDVPVFTAWNQFYAAEALKSYVGAVLYLHC